MSAPRKRENCLPSSDFGFQGHHRFEQSDLARADVPAVGKIETNEKPAGD